MTWATNQVATTRHVNGCAEQPQCDGAWISAAASAPSLLGMPALAARQSGLIFPIRGNEASVPDACGCRRGTALACAVVLLLSACVSPAINADGYRGKVMQSAKKMSGLIGAARLAAQLDLDHKMLRTVTDNVVTDAENDAGSVVTALDSVQPPDAVSVKLRDHADEILQDASSQLADLRIALRRNDEPGMRAAMDDLANTLVEAEHLQDST
ncbi:MAG TPA: hypothetical protein VEL02_10200 [Jatrophihabitantaceae bacterium]|nr:hypothetical protein [Jatrophihabitantaceae bacterium]